MPVAFAFCFRPIITLLLTICTQHANTQCTSCLKLNIALYPQKQTKYLVYLCLPMQFISHNASAVTAGFRGGVAQYCGDYWAERFFFLSLLTSSIEVLLWSVKTAHTHQHCLAGQLQHVFVTTDKQLNEDGVDSCHNRKCLLLDGRRKMGLNYR